jgi:hypothetical protein
MLFVAETTLSEPPLVLRSPDGHYWALKNTKKIVVVCLQGDPKTNRRLEEVLAVSLKNQGIEALGAHDFLSGWGAFSAKSIVGGLKKAGVDHVVQLTYSGPLVQEVSPQLMRLTAYTLSDKKKVFSTNYGSLDTALISLITEVSKNSVSMRGEQDE